uniref:7TM GPCR serpentine receptor class x (Srx) domain-containing protein n=1 Tax=Onchocerca volvulus TaxID=6282 RepID=A0A8R1TSF0_ONCVO
MSLNCFILYSSFFHRKFYSIQIISYAAEIYCKIFQLAFIGLFAYILSLSIISKSSRYHNAFGILCFAYVFFHIQTIDALLIWTVIRILVPKNARIIVVSLWLSSILITALYYNVECGHYFEADNYSWSTLFGPCKHSFLVYIAMFLSNGILLTVLIVDAVACYRLIVYFKKRKSRKNSVTQQKLGQEILFFKETCVTTVIHVFCVIISHIEMPVSRLTKITYVWLAIHTLDGLAFVFFNRHTLKK